jgi:hypothetical protein
MVQPASKRTMVQRAHIKDKEIPHNNPKTCFLYASLVIPGQHNQITMVLDYQRAYISDKVIRILTPYGSVLLPRLVSA